MPTAQDGPSLLETAWREAEEIAAISDNMFLPRSVGQFFERQTGHQTPPPDSA
jgi:hypothetical protein